jgi:hypothetical protein
MDMLRRCREYVDFKSSLLQDNLSPDNFVISISKLQYCEFGQEYCVQNIPKGSENCQFYCLLTAG